MFVYQQLDHKHKIFLFLNFFIKSIEVESLRSEVSGLPLNASPTINIFELLKFFPIFLENNLI